MSEQQNTTEFTSISQRFGEFDPTSFSDQSTEQYEKINLSTARDAVNEAVSAEAPRLTQQEIKDHSVKVISHTGNILDQLREFLL